MMDMEQPRECVLCGRPDEALRPYVLRWAPYGATQRERGQSSGTSGLLAVCATCDGPHVFFQLAGVIVARNPNLARSPRVPHLTPEPCPLGIYPATRRLFYYCTSCDECTMFEPYPAARDRLCANCGTNSHLVPLHGLEALLSYALRNEHRGEGLVRLVPGVVRS